MNLSWKLGRIAGIDLFLHPTFLLIMGWAALQRGLDGMLLISAVFGCVVLHEFGHALTARLFGVQTRDITLYPIGGVARLERMPRAPGAELLITLAGPLVNVAIAGFLFLGLWAAGAWEPWTEPSLAADFAGQLMFINVALAVFNMLPAFPMDGGRVLRAILSAPLGRYRATEIAAGLGRALALGLPLAGLWFGVFNPMYLVLAVFIYFAAGMELAQVRAEEPRREWGYDDDGIRTAPPGYRWVSRGNGFWQLAPINVHVDPRDPRSWR